MSILRFVRQAIDFDDTTTRVMGEAFDAACAEKTEQSAQELIALRIDRGGQERRARSGSLKARRLDYL